MLPTMIPSIEFYDKERTMYRITYYEKNYMQSAYFCDDKKVASSHNDFHTNAYLKYYIDPNSDKFTDKVQNFIKNVFQLTVLQYVALYDISQKREAKLQNSPNCHIDTYHEVLYTVSDLFIPFGSMDVRSFAEEFLWATQTFFGEQELVEAIENQLEEIGAEPGDINNYIYAMYCAIEEEIWNVLENMPEDELVNILRQNGWDAMAKHVEHLIEIDELSSEIEETKARRMNDTKYNIDYCASSFNWEPLDQSFRSEGHDQTLARVFEGAYRQYIDENYDGVCDAENEDCEEECSDTES